MSPCARLHGDRTARLSREKLKQSTPPQLRAEPPRPRNTRPMHLEYVLRQIQADCPNLAHGRLPQVVFNTSTLAQRCRRGASTPSMPPQELVSIGERVGVDGAALAQGGGVV